MSERRPPGFTLYADKMVMLALLPDDEAGQVIKAAISFYYDGVLPDNFNINQNRCFDLIKANIEESYAKYEAACKRNKGNRNSGKSKKNTSGD